MFTPLDHQYYQHEAEALRIMRALERLGWVFWN